MQLNEDDDEFQIIDSHYELTNSNNSNNHLLPQKSPIIYQIHIKPTKIEVDLSIMENQYYQLDVKKKGLNYCIVERRFSEFELIFDILTRKEGGYIFPGFPSNGIFAFMKSKVVISKDEEFINRRIRTIERFMNIVMNDSLFDPDHCKELKEFLSAGREFQARKQIQKSNKAVFSFSWNKLKNYFTTTKENKYSDKQQKLQKIKNSLESLYTKCRGLIDCLKEQLTENERLPTTSQSNQVLRYFKDMMDGHDCLQKQNLKKLQELQFDMFCENEDLHMCDKIFDRINELKNDEDNYVELKAIENRFEAQINGFIAQKTASMQNSQEALKKLVAEIKKVGRIVK